MVKTRGLMFAGVFLALSSQSASALDCSKAWSEAEKIICGKSYLKEIDATMEKAYFSLRKKLGPLGRKKLQIMQRQWLAKRNQMIIESTISQTTENHTEFLKNTPPGMVPFQKESQSNAGKIVTRIKGYKFPAPDTPVRKAFNTLFDRLYRQTRVEPDDKADEDVEATAVTRFDQYILSSRISTTGYYGGPHPLHFSVLVNIDVKTAKPLTIKSLFSAAVLKKLSLSCAVQIAENRNMFEEDTPEKTLTAINEDYPDQIIKHLSDATRWQFEDSKANIIFDEYFIAPYAAGEQICFFEYKVLTELSKTPAYFKTPKVSPSESQ